MILKLYTDLQRPSPLNPSLNPSDVGSMADLKMRAWMPLMELKPSKYHSNGFLGKTHIKKSVFLVVGPLRI